MAQVYRHQFYQQLRLTWVKITTDTHIYTPLTHSFITESGQRSAELLQPPLCSMNSEPSPGSRVFYLPMDHKLECHILQHMDGLFPIVSVVVVLQPLYKSTRE